MAKLTIKLNGEEVHQLQLESGQEYIAGRGQDAQIRLDQQRGISRHHLKFCERDGVWICESLSKFVHILKGADSMNVIELNEPCVFMVPPFEFVFEPTPTQTESPAKPLENPPAFFQPRVTPLAEAAPIAEHTAPRANNEATVAGGANLIPYFRISFPNTADDEILKLEGQLWIAGRDSDCEIHIDSPHVSRKHFELARTNSGYFVTDLGSSNGTRVNGQRIAAHEPTQIISGDELRVQNIEMTFEIRDMQFSNRMDRLPVASFNTMALGGNLPMPWDDGFAAPQAYDPTQYRPSSRDFEEDPNGWHKLVKAKPDWRQNKVRLALFVLVPLVLVMAFLPSKPTEQKPAGTGDHKSDSVSFENLPKEKKMVVKDSFNLASSLYTSGKYALCLTELAKLHELIPQYQNSKELQSFCEQGLELQRRAEDAERQRRERERIESQVQGYVDTCKAKLGADSTVDETRQCLSPAIELAPDHNLVVEMIHTAQMHEEEKKFMAQEHDKEMAKVAKGVAHFNRALNIYKEGKLARSIGEFEKFVSVPYPRSGDLKEKAKRQIASIKAELKVKVSTFLEQCKALGAKSAWRDAYKACDQAVGEDQSNAEALELRHHMLSELRREMKSIYEDSVLEESMGNVDTAKEKWKKIMQEDLQEDDYTTKARGKLQKYGAGG